MVCRKKFILFPLCMCLIMAKIIITFCIVWSFSWKESDYGKGNAVQDAKCHVIERSVDVNLDFFATYLIGNFRNITWKIPFQENMNSSHEFIHLLSKN